jgi:hypothetical protein
VSEGGFSEASGISGSSSGSIIGGSGGGCGVGGGIADRLAAGLCTNAHEVFLGGACNPTTWRATAAIPFLEAAGVTYYNPQVDDCELPLWEVAEAVGWRCRRVWLVAMRR